MVNESKLQRMRMFDVYIVSSAGNPIGGSASKYGEGEQVIVNSSY